jgi:hypothetical protein
MKISSKANSAQFIIHLKESAGWWWWWFFCYYFIALITLEYALFRLLLCLFEEVVWRIVFCTVWIVSWEWSRQDIAQFIYVHNVYMCVYVISREACDVIQRIESKHSLKYILIKHAFCLRIFLFCVYIFTLLARVGSAYVGISLLLLY